MLRVVLDLLSVRDYTGLSKELDIACGKNEIKTSFKEAWKDIKREKRW